MQLALPGPGYDRHWPGRDQVLVKCAQFVALCCHWIYKQLCEFCFCCTSPPLMVYHPRLAGPGILDGGGLVGSLLLEQGCYTVTCPPVTPHTSGRCTPLCLFINIKSLLASHHHHPEVFILYSSSSKMYDFISVFASVRE